MSAASTESVLGIAVRDIGRLRRVATVVTRHGFGELLARSPLGGRFGGGKADEAEAEDSAPIRFRRLLEELGPTWIKLGQILSTRHDLLPPDYIEALGELQDSTPELPFEIIKPAVEEGLGKPLDVLFAHFDDKPLGTASIAQTHRARTHAGDEVVVKVQRPNIEASMRGDLDLLYIAARVLEHNIEEMQLYSPSEIVAEFERGLLRELNFANELSNLEAARQFLDPERPVVVPRPYPELSSKTILTMEFFDGRPFRAIEPGTDEAQYAAAELIRAAAKQVFIDGFFHGDPHAGNMLINDDRVLCMIDLGLVGRLTQEQRDQIVTLAIAAMTNDASTMASTLLSMGTPTERVNLSELKAEILRIRREQLEVSSLTDYDSGAFAQEFAAAAARFKIRLAPEYSIMVKAAATLEGVVRALDPDVDIINIARPYAEEVVQRRFAPDQVMQNALARATGMGGLVQRLPDHIEQLLHDMETGNLQLRAITPELDHLPHTLRWSVSRQGIAMFAASMSICCAILLAANPVTQLQIAAAVGTFLLACGAWGIHLVAQYVGTGQAVRLAPLIKLFRRD